MKKPCILLALFVFALFAISSVGLLASDPPDTIQLLAKKDLQALGQKIFFDENLSRPAGQSCASCHDVEVGWSGPDLPINQAGGIYEGATQGRFSSRKPPSSAYATLSPKLHLGEEGFVGGNFWDGRATGWMLGNPAADQAQGPFLNPVEHNLPDAASLVAKVCAAEYKADFKAQAKAHWGIADICAAFEKNPETAFAIVALAIAAFEHSPAMNAFNSKYDRFLAGKVRLSPLENKGLALFEGKGKCAECHPTRPGPDGSPPLFTDFTYDNLGFPKNPKNPFYRMPKSINPEGGDWIDRGLGNTLALMPAFAWMAEEAMGLHRVPTLRNIDLRPRPDFLKVYGHNGVFESLELVVNFYNTRDVLPDCAKIKNAKMSVNCWPAPELRANMNKEELGDLKLTAEEVLALVAFMKTLSDDYPPMEKK